MGSFTQARGHSQLDVRTVGEQSSTTRLYKDCIAIITSRIRKESTTVITSAVELFNNIGIVATTNTIINPSQ